MGTEAKVSVRTSRSTLVGAHSSVSAEGRSRQLGDFPWASALMRCFIVGGRAAAKVQDHCGSVGVVTGVVFVLLPAGSG